MERSNFMKDNHDSYIEEINRIKIRIHQSLYNGGPFLDNLLESVHRHLPSMNNISYDDNRDCLILTTDRVVSSISLSLFEGRLSSLCCSFSGRLGFYSTIQHSSNNKRSRQKSSTNLNISPSYHMYEEHNRV